MYSVAIILSCLEFLKMLNINPISYKKVIKIKRYVYTTPSIILENLEKASLIHIKQGYIYINDKGKKYLIETDVFDSNNDFKVKQVIKDLLKEFLISHRFSWLKHLYKGRFEGLKKIPNIDIRRNMVFLLKELNLFYETTKDVLAWWNDIEKQFISIHEYKEEIGELGEKYSIEYELMRVGKMPHWESIFSSFSGYDLLSVVNKDNKVPLKIEVKSTNKEYAFYLTSNEWITALQSQNYIFHLWYLPKKELLIFSQNQIKHHIPINTNKTEWTECKITLSDKEVKLFCILHNFSKY